jgi:hypothetical protein
VLRKNKIAGVVMWRLLELSTLRRPSGGEVGGVTKLKRYRRKMNKSVEIPLVAVSIMQLIWWLKQNKQPSKQESMAKGEVKDGGDGMEIDGEAEPKQNTQEIKKPFDMPHHFEDVTADLTIATGHSYRETKTSKS